LTFSSAVGISREAAVAWIVSDSKLVSFTSRHLGTGPTQHDTFVRARCNRVVPPALATYLYLVPSRSIALPPPSSPLPSSFLPAPCSVSRRRGSWRKRDGYTVLRSQCRGHAYKPDRDWPDPIHVAMVTFLRPSVHQCPCSRLCPFNYPFHVC
ncbi:hypothetical protein WH47_06112, partial [Habropoda laboriosa]